jgi:triosephosphate isomerase
MIDIKNKQKKGVLIVNLKNYLETAGDNTIKIAKDAENVSNETGVEIIIAPPQPSVALIVKTTRLKVISQHIDLEKAGATTGYYIAEMIEKIGAIGSLINHSEHGLEIAKIGRLIEKLKELRLKSFVCSKSITELKEIISFEPDFIAIEPPELIGSKKSISSENPSLIKECYKLIQKENQHIQLICGAGINTKKDIEIALENGAQGILVSSSITKAENWYNKILELASSF